MTSNVYTKEQILQTLKEKNEFKIILQNKDLLVIDIKEGDYYDIGVVKSVSVYYVEMCGEEGYVVSSQYWPVSKIEDAVDVFMERFITMKPMMICGKSYKLEEVKVFQDQVLFFSNHYTYLEYMIEKFWVKVFNKTLSDMWCSGIISAHGDKCYGYRDKWKEAGINHNRGSLLFLLTYTKQMDGTPKHLSDQWVMENYQKYLPIIEEIEQEVLKEHFGA